jgi:hypothetical protein
MSQDQIQQMQAFFKEKKYLVIREFLSKDVANLFYNYCINRTIRADFMISHAKDQYSPEWDGQFGDPQIKSNSYIQYGDLLMDTLLLTSLQKLQLFSGVKLLPNYTYWRLYQQGDMLARHSDRESCEISTTLCLGYNVSNVDANVHPNYNWPMFVEDNEITDLEGLPIHLDPGDLILYRGCDVDHWRDEFIGLNHAQVFMHYTDADGPFQHYLDGRPIVGIPKKYQKTI